MASQAESEIVLYDLSCIKNVCFSPVVWRIRMMLNYKGIAYRTVFLEFQDIEPTLKKLGLEPASTSEPRYTVPAIHHPATDTYLMGSGAIAKFIETKYPERPLKLESDHGNAIMANARAMARGAYLISLIAREPAILTPPAQEYFQRTRPDALESAQKVVADPAQEEKAWVDASESLRALDDLVQTHASAGPFVLGAGPSYADLFLAGNLQSARVISEVVFERMMEYAGLKNVYEACLPFMERKD